jgi:hypothetical protein
MASTTKKLTIKLDEKHTFVLEPDDEQPGFAMWAVYRSRLGALTNSINRLVR